MFPGSNTNADLGYNKHNQYMAQPPHFLGGPNSGNVPGPGIGNTVRSAVPVMPLNMQGSIDWAQLAQQWIHMRDSTAAPPLANFSMNPPIAPPPPIISNAPEYQTQPELRHQQSKALTHFEEHGEAEMDMDEEENESNVRAIPDIKNVPPPPVATQAQWLDSSAPITVAPIDAAGSCAQPWSNWPARVHPTAHIPSLLKLNVCNPNETQHLMQPIQQPQQNNNNGGNVASSEIDANKRKMLPAWIREGLEKMEREKQRQLERQQCTTPEDDSSAINVKQVSSKTLTTPVNLLNISNMASDSEDSIAAPEEAAQAISMAHLIGNDVLNKTSGSDEEQDTEMDKRQQQSQHQYAVDGQKPTIARAANAEAALSGKNYEERLADLMLVVRRTLTEILLETTNEEIAAIATETVKAHRAKASSAQVIRKSALSSITGKLGLAAYGDSSSESGEDDNSDNNDGSQVEHNFDSTTKSTELTADELKTRIRKSKRAFEKVIDDIEERVSLQEQVDEQKLQHHRKLELERTKTATEQRSESPTDAIPSTTMTSGLKTSEKSQFNGKRHSRKERTTRFSDNKDSKQSQSYVSQVVAVTSAAQNSVLPPKLKPVPNPATNLLQMPDSMATMLNAADKALDKAQKTSKKTKARRRQSSSSSSSSSSSDSSSSSSSSDSNSTSNSSKSSSHTDGSSTRSSLATKKRSSTSNRRSRGRSSRKQRSETSRERHRKGHSSSSRHSYNRHHSSRERDRDRHALHYSSQRNERRRRHQQRDSSNSGDEDGSDYRRSSRHSSSRSHQSNSYGKHRDKTRSRSNSRSTHNSYSSASTSHQQRKRH